MKHKYLPILLVLGLLVGVWAVAATVTPARAAPDAIAPNGPEVEPNDDFDTATPFATNWGEGRPVVSRNGIIDPRGDVDFYQFGAPPLAIFDIEWKAWGSPLQGMVSLYNEDGTLIAESPCANGVCLQYVSLTGGTYYLKVRDANGAGGPLFTYGLSLHFLGFDPDPNEPNDTPAQATPIDYEQRVAGSCCGTNGADRDYFVFQGQTGDMIEVDNWNFKLLDSELNLILEGNSDGATHFAILPATGPYYILPNVGGVYTLAVRRYGHEPDDTAEQATPITYGSEIGNYLWPCGDTDVYSFSGKAGDDVDVGNTNEGQLLDSRLNVLADGYDIRATLPADGVYYVRVGVEWGDCENYYPNPYWIRLRLLGNNEPNDSAAEAGPIYYGDELGGLVSCIDADYFAFNGQAGDEVGIEKVDWSYVNAQILDAGQNVLAESGFDGRTSLQFTLPTSGVYYLRLPRFVDWCDPDSYNYPRNTPYQIAFKRLVRPVYFSLNKGGTLQGVKFTAGDILVYSSDTGKIEMYADLSDLGLNGNLTALDAFRGCSFLPGDPSLLFGFAGAYALPGIGQVLPQDLVYANLTATGADTAGSVGFALDGSDIGLTTAAERIDAIASVGRWCQESLDISTTGQARVPYGLGSMTFQNEDVVTFHPDFNNFRSPLSTDTRGEWVGPGPLFDGSTFGLGAANLVAADKAWDELQAVPLIWLVFDRTVTLGGVRFAPGDIAQCMEGCDHAVTKFFDASDAGLGTYRIDALVVGEYR